MERIQSINPERIAWCCADYGITPSALAAEIGIAEASIDRVMEREDGLTFGQLRKIAEYFGRGTMFFLEPGPVDESQAHSPQFRTLANQKPTLTSKLRGLIERVEKQRAVYLSLGEDRDEADRLSFSPPEFAQKGPREVAHIARHWLALGDRNSLDISRTAVEAQGVLVFRSNGYNGKWQIAKEYPILGFTLYDPTCPVIFIKKQPWESQQLFTLMHELGHLLLHKSSSIDDEHDLQSHEGRERDANAFAGHLLVPDAFLSSIHDVEPPGDVSQYDLWLKQQRKDWGVSTEVILRRLLEVGRLSQSQYAAYRLWSGQVTSAPNEDGSRKYRYREPKHMFGDPFVRAVLDALNARYITLEKASSYLDNLTIKDLHALEHYYAGL